MRGNEVLSKGVMSVTELGLTLTRLQLESEGYNLCLVWGFKPEISQLRLGGMNALRSDHSDFGRGLCVFLIRTGVHGPAARDRHRSDGRGGSTRQRRREECGHRSGEESA